MTNSNTNKYAKTLIATLSILFITGLGAAQEVTSIGQASPNDITVAESSYIQEIVPGSIDVQTDDASQTDVRVDISNLASVENIDISSATATVSTSTSDTISNVNVNSNQDRIEFTVTPDSADFTIDQIDLEGINTENVDPSTASISYNIEAKQTGDGNFDFTADTTKSTSSFAFVATADEIDVSVTNDNALADDSVTNEWTATVTDTDGNPIDGETVKVSSGNDENSLTGVSSGGTSDTDSDGEVTFTASSSEAGDYTLGLELDSDSGVSGTATSTYTNPDSVSVTTNTGTATADGSSELDYTATIEDGTTPVRGVSVSTTDDGSNIAYDGDDS